MRLLNAHTLEFRFYFDERPPYLILSHRWTVGETSLQDFMVERHLTADKWSNGTKKVMRFCELVKNAKQDDGKFFEWCWVDTCCIDKTSSAELTEAINSMYRWYREAEECYVFINDLNHSVLSHCAPEALPQEIKDEFIESHWFTRGWTLQELLAPRKQTFLDNEWSSIGTRTQLAPIITELTGIDGKCFGDEEEIRSRCIAERMTWISRRETSRSEDLAYCLLGIFGVHMPLIYGEGMHAFRRLQEEIIRNSFDETIFAWFTEDDRPKSGILATHPHDFALLKGTTLLRSEYFDRKPYSITNKGLKLQIYDLPDYHLFQTIEIPLNVEKSGGGFVLLTLGRGEHRQYFRKNCHQPCYVPGSVLPMPSNDSFHNRTTGRELVRIFLKP